MTKPVHSTAAPAPSIDNEIDALVARHPQLRREGGREFALALLRFTDAARSFDPSITGFGIGWAVDFASRGGLNQFSGVYATHETEVRS